MIISYQVMIKVGRHSIQSVLSNASTHYHSDLFTCACLAADSDSEGSAFTEDDTLADTPALTAPGTVVKADVMHVSAAMAD